MLSNYSLLVWRNLLRQPVASAINILTLAIGLTAATVAIIILYYHLGFEQQYPNADRIYQIRHHVSLPNGETYDHPAIPYKYYQSIQQSHPELATAIYSLTLFIDPKQPNSKVQLNSLDITRKTFLKADQNFWKLFDIPFVAGDAKTALSQPYTLVITKSSAKRLFGDKEALGQVVQLDKWPMRIVGVIPDFPEQTILNPDRLTPEKNFSGLFVSASSKEITLGMNKTATEIWGEFESIFSYIMLPSGSSTDALEQDLTALVLKDRPQATTVPANIQLKIAPLKGLHLRESVQSNTGLNTNSWKFLIILLSMASAILAVACLNSTVISTTLYQRRAIEIGIRKISGATTSSIARQFFSESLGITALATAVAAALLMLSIPWINQATTANLGSVNFITPTFFCSLLALVVLVSVATAWYPAYRLGRTSPTSAIEQQSHTQKKNHIITALTILQFIFSIALFSILVSAIAQLQYISQINLGANFDNLILFNNKQPIFSPETTINIRAKLLENPDILSARNIDYFYGTPLFQSKVEFANNKKASETKDLTVWPTNPDGFLEHYQIKLLAGNSFSKTANFLTQQEYTEYIRDGQNPQEALLTLQGLKKIGLTDSDDAIGTTITTPNKQSYTIVGVVNAFPKITSETDFLGSDIIAATWNSPGYHSIRYRKGAKESVKNHIQSVVKNQTDGTDEAVFVDSKPLGLQQLEYKLHEPITQLAPLGIAALLISVMGLYAISLLNAQRRTHEIGIRKVLGASRKRLSGLMVFDSCKPLLISLIIGLPAGYLISRHFLQVFIEQPPIALIVFVLVPVVVTLIAILVTLGHALQTAKCDPAKVLRSQ